MFVFILFSIKSDDVMFEALSEKQKKYASSMACIAVNGKGNHVSFIY